MKNFRNKGMRAEDKYIIYLKIKIKRVIYTENRSRNY